MTSIAKELHRLIRRVGKLTDGQASVCDLDWEDGEVDNFIVEIRPNSGCYKGGIFKFRIFIPSDYESDEPPTVHCETDIYHPNIDTTDLEYDTTGCNVCLNLLDRGTWSRKFGLEGVILGIVFLIYNPNLTDPLTPDFDSGLTIEDFEENVKKYMKGEDVDERTFSADFLENLQSNSGANDCTDTADTATGDCDKDSETKDNQTDDVKEHETAEEKDADKIDIEISEEDLSTRDSVINTENESENQTEEPVQSTAVNENNTKSETDNNKINSDTGARNDSEINLQENLLKQLEETGFQNENDPNDDSDSCTTITIDEDIVLVTSDPAQLQQEENCEKQIVNENSNSDEVTEEQTAGASGISEKNSEEANDSYSAVHSIIDELVENTINIHFDEDKDCNVNLPILNLTTNDSNVAGIDISDIEGYHTLENDKIASDSVGAVANDNELQSVINKETSLGRHSYIRQKSRESVKTQVNALDNCVPYLKFVIIHAFRCLTKL